MSNNSYIDQLASAIRTKSTELSWLLIEAEARLALSREWTEEAFAAGEPDWMRYQHDIEKLQAILKDARDLLKHVSVGK